MIGADIDGGALLRVAHLTKRYGRVTALDDVSCTVRAGEIVGLIGPNGAGKTTFLECIAGLLPRDAGTIVVNGRTLRPGESSPALLYLPDGVAPWPAETVRWALAFATGFFGGRQPAADAMAHDLGVESLLDRRIGTLSKGQLRRAVLAIGLMLPQPILAVDEPFDGLDLRQTRAVAAALERYAAAGRTFLLSIHQIADASRLCDRFILLSDGRVRGEGTLDDLAARPAVLSTGARAHDLEDVFLALT